jgi:phosphatidylglycerophosphate synthase
MIKERFGSSVDRLVLGIAPLVARMPLSANQLTFVGVLIAFASAAAFATGRAPLGAVLLILSGFADLCDGIVARARGTQSRAGAFLDSSMDRVSDLAIYAGMAVFAASQADAWLTMLVLWALAGAVLTSYTRARAESELGEFKVGFMERAERFLVLIPLALLDRLEWALWILAIGGTLTSMQRLWVAYWRIQGREGADRQSA